MADLGVFAEPGFDHKAWINAAVAGRPPDEPLERFLAETEMRLQLGGEELEAALAECSSAALRRVPFAQQEVSRLRGDVGALQVSCKGLLSSVEADAQAAKASAAPLAALHTARCNMEAGCATLREAAELSGAFKRVEEVFAAGDLPRVADMLRSMARSLALVGDVPEFREGRSQLAALEDRLQRRVEGRLGEALQANAGAEVASLAALLLAVGRFRSVEAAYIASRMPLVTAMWDEAATMLAGAPAAAGAGAAGAAGGGGGGAGLAGGWLLLLYNSLLGLFESDAAWLGGCLPQQRALLLVALIAAAFERLNKQVAAKLGGISSTRLLGGVMPDVLVAARRLRELLAVLAASAPAPAGKEPPPGSKAAAADAAAARAAEVAGDELQLALRLLKLVLDPLEQQVSRFTQLEEGMFSAKLSAPLPVTPAAAKPQQQPSAAGAAPAQEDEEELDAEVSAKLDASCLAAFSCLSGVLERCMLLTGGTELAQLQVLLDRAVAGYLQRLQAAVGIINGRYTRLAAAASPGADAGVMLQLVLLARNISSRLNALETQLRSSIGTAIPRLQQLAAAGLPPLGASHHASLAPGGGAAASAGGAAAAAAAAGSAGGGHAGAAADVPAATAAAAAELLPLRVALYPEKLRPLDKLRAAAADARFMSLPTANAAGAALCEAISSAVYDALMAPVLAALAPLPGLQEWAAAAPGAGTGVVAGMGASVPAFSAYPLGCVTAVGEYLMALPQQLEVLMASAPGAGLGGDADEPPASDGDDDGDELAAEWLDKVVRGAGGAYCDALMRIPRLSPPGAAQLAADAEYVANVMSALAVPPSRELITAQLFAAAPGDSFEQLAAGALAGGSADAKVLKALAHMRGLEWVPPSAASQDAS